MMVQVMAVYDGVGRLLRGHPDKEKTVIDYIVMERHLENPERGYGWRIAGKLPPQVPWKTLLNTHSDQNKPQSLPAA